MNTKLLVAVFALVVSFAGRGFTQTGPAPDITGQNKANPLAAIGSAAAMLEYSFGLKDEGAAVDQAIQKVLAGGKVTADLKPKGKPASTSDVGQAVCDAIG